MKTEFVIRLARPEERSALENLLRRASLVWEETRAALLAHPEAMELPLEQIEAGHVCVAEQGGSIVGFGVFLLREDGDFDIDGLFVEPVAWKQGIGRSLVQEAGHRAGAHGARVLHVIANPRTQGFYTACRFELIGETGTRFGVGLVMQKGVAVSR